MLKLKYFPDNDKEIEVPNIEASDEELSEFALSFNGYKFLDGGPEKISIVHAKTVTLIQNDKDWLSKVSIEDLRCGLFWQQRGDRWHEDFQREEYIMWVKLIKEKLSLIA